MRTSRVALGVLMAALVAALPVVALADDEWEFIQGGLVNDDAGSTVNQLVHGSRQRHDLQGTLTPTDQDWSVVSVKNRHSYEAMAFNSTFCWIAGSCPTMNRVDFAGTVLTAGVGFDGQDSSVVARWIATADANEYIRVNGFVGGIPMDANAKYDILLRETTLNIARWNQSGSQSTVVLLRNTTAAPITGDLHFYSAAGALLDTQAVSIPAHGLQVFSTAAIPALSGLAGSAAVAHVGPYGGIAGKAVALEPGTGFTFDTAVESIPY